MKRRFASALLLASLVLHAFPVLAQTQRPESTNYQIPSDVQPAGGGDKAKSNLYLLDDTIGEPNVGPSRSTNYDLDAGYRQTVADAYLAMTCDPTTNIGTITFTGQQTGSSTCSVITDSEAGYSLAWIVSTGSGGTNTGYLISENEDVIAPYVPTVIDTPETWSVGSNEARWGGRLSSTSDDSDIKWGTDASSEKWLNVGTGSYTIVTRSTRTDPAGSSEVLQFRAEIGANVSQPTGTYQTTVTLTASAL